MSDRNTQDAPDTSAESADELANPLPDEAFPSDAVNSQREAYKKKRRLDARTWVPDESVAVIWKSITIGSQMVQKNWNMLFVRAQTTLFMLQHIVPSAGDLATARSLEGVLTDRLTELENSMRDEIGRLKALAAADGITSIPAKSYVNPEEITVPIYTPGAQRFLALLCSVDELVWLLDYLWLQGVIKVEYKFQVMNTWRNLLWGMVKFTTQTWVRARTALRAAQRAQAAKDAARRFARAAKNAGAAGDDGAEGGAEGDAVDALEMTVADPV